MPTTEIRIDDLAEPCLSPTQQQVVDAIAPADVDLSRASLVARAAQRSRLADPDIEGGDPTIWDRLDAYLAAVEADTGLNGVGRLVQQSRVIRLLSQRALLHDLLARRPEIRQIELPSPLVVVGLPRSGTTHLVNLLAADPGRRALPYWESQAPFPTPGRGPGVNGLDPRYVWAQQEHALADTMTPHLKWMHDRFPEAIEEEVELLDLDLCTYQLEWNVRGTAWRDYSRALDQDAHFAYLRTILQALTWLRGPQRWVLKCPQHLENLGPLMRTFPDATVAFTHRDPVASIISAITMLGYGDRMRRTSIDPAGLVAQWSDRYALLLDSVVAERHLVPEPQSIDVTFTRLVKNDVAVVQALHERAGEPLAAHQLDAFARWSSEQRSTREARMVYDLQGDFGVRPEELRERFAPYLERFGVSPEL